MTLTGQGYVALGAQAAPAKGVRKDNPYHDERGRFTTADGAGGAASRGTKLKEHTAQGGVPDEENRGEEEPADPLAETRNQQWGDAVKTLRALDPKNTHLSYATAPDWVPTDKDIANINAEIAKVAVKRVTDYVMPGGHMIGTPGGGPDVRNLPGGTKAAEAAFNYLRVGGTPYSGEYPGEMVVLPENTGWVGLRINDENVPTVDVNVPKALGSTRFHFPRD